MMNDILKNLSSWVLPLIFIFTAIGVWCAIWAIYGVWRDASRLEKCDKEMDFSSEEQQFDSRKMKLDAYIQKLSKGKDMARVGEGKLLQLRLETIRDAIEAQSTKLMPSLHDLHSLSEQDEMSRRSSCWLRTITSFLLIMGILGTLTGVHKVLENGSANIPELGKALQPSMYAVFFTIILMWLRGWYVAKLDGYLEKLDLFTMTELMPFLQPVTDVVSTSINLSQNLEELKRKEKELVDLNNRMKELHGNMKKYVEVASMNKQSIATLKDTLNTVSCQLARGRDSVAALSSLEQSANQLKEHFNAGVSQIEKYVQETQPRCESIAAQYGHLLGNLNTVSQDVAHGRATSEDIKNKASYMNEMGKLVSSYDSNLSGMSEKMLQVEKVLAEVNTMKEKVTNSQNLVNDSSKQATEMLNKSKKMMQSIGDSNTDFSHTMNDGIRDVQFAMDTLAKKIDDLDKVGKDLAIAWGKSAKERAL